jgi:hypothetical protein
MNVTINGVVHVGNRILWRIERLSRGKEGLEFLAYPLALVPDRDDAELICQALRAFTEAPDAQRDAVDIEVSHN